MELGIKIKQLRKMHGLSQKELGEKINKKQNTISTIENGGGTDISTIKLIASVFNLTVDELFQDISSSNSDVMPEITSETLQNKLISIDSYIEGLIKEGLIKDSDDLNEATSKAVISITKAYIDYLILNKNLNDN